MSLYRTIHQQIRVDRTVLRWVGLTVLHSARCTTDACARLILRCGAGWSLLPRASLILLYGSSLVILSCFSLVPAPSSAQSNPLSAWPARPLRLVATFPPGGITDFTARMVAPKLSEALGQPVVVENRSGSGGNIGTDFVAKSSPDGYTLLLGPGGAIAINPSLFEHLDYDPVRDLVPVSAVARAPFVVMVANDAAAPASFAELIARARARPGELSYGSGGSGSAMHLTGEQFRHSIGAQIVHVPFKGSVLAWTTMVNGQLSMVWVDTTTMNGALKSGKVRVLAVTSRERSSLVPGVPTVAEAGIPDFEMIGWFGLFAPAGTPADLVARISTDVRYVLALPEVRERVFATGNEAWGSTPEALGAFVRSELAHWARVVRETGARPD